MQRDREVARVTRLLGQIDKKLGDEITPVTIGVYLDVGGVDKLREFMRNTHEGVKFDVIILYGDQGKAFTFDELPTDWALTGNNIKKERSVDRKYAMEFDSRSGYGRT